MQKSLHQLLELYPTAAKAFAVADAAHRAAGQVRNPDNRPYIIHPLTVANILVALQAPATVIQAALLHDVLEDTAVGESELLAHFGSEVVERVKEVTAVSVSREVKRPLRTEENHAHYARASAWGQSLKMADRIHNLIEITQHDAGFARKVYWAESSELFSMLTLAHPLLQTRANRVLTWSARKLNISTQKGQSA